jgi:nitroreductase
MDNTTNAKLAVLFGRRSIRIYRSGQVSDETIQTLLEAAMAAPSACAKDPWRFVVIRERATLARLTQALPNGQMLATAAVGIFVCGDLEAAHDRQLSYLLQDCSAAIENLLLAVHALGLGAVWLGVHPREDRIAQVRQVLHLPDGVIPVAGIALGHPGETKEPRTRFKSAFVHRETW